MEASLGRLAPSTLVLLFGVASIMAKDANDDASNADGKKDAQANDNANAKGDDDQVFANYVPTTTDPGMLLFYIALCVCLGSSVLMTQLVRRGWYIRRHRLSGSDIGEDGIWRKGGLRCEAILYRLLEKGRSGAMKLRRGGKNKNMRAAKTERGIEREYDGHVYVYESACGAFECFENEELSERAVEVVMNHSFEGYEEPTTSAYDPPEELKVIPGRCEYEMSTSDTKQDLVGAINESRARDVCLEKKVPTCSAKWLRKKAMFTWTILRLDEETRRIWRLVLPFTASALVENVTELINLALVSRALGTNAILAWIMVDTVMGTTATFTGGCLETITSLGSMAYGARNYVLVGQYFKTSCLIYVLCELPVSIALGWYIGPVLEALGLGESVANLAIPFVWFQVWMNIVGGLQDGVLGLLEVAEHELFASFMYCLECIADVGLMWYFTNREDVSLVMLGWVCSGSTAFFTAISILLPALFGWLGPFQIYSWDLGGAKVLSRLVETSLPLSIGGVLAYAEWEVLIFLAATLGPAEAATWGLMGYVWGVFESVNEAVGCAGEVRCSYRLGRGEPALAKLSSYKSMSIALSTSLLISTVAYWRSEDLTEWITYDPTIQGMLQDLIPLVTLGNITMNVGMVCWALIGGQGRYRLATIISSACSLLITLPIGLFLTLAMRFNLKGLTFAVVVGYSATAMCLTYVLLMSNWEKLSLKIQRKSKVKGVEHSDSMLTEGSSESENEVTSRGTSPAYEMSLTQANESSGCEQSLQIDYYAADEGSASIHAIALPLASPANQERPREIDDMQGAQPGITKNDQVIEQLNSQDATLEDSQPGVRSTMRTEPLSFMRPKSSRGTKRGGFRANLILEKSPKRSSVLYEL